MVDTSLTDTTAQDSVTHPNKAPAGGWSQLRIQYCEWDGTTESNCQTTPNFNTQNGGAASAITTYQLTGLKTSTRYRQRAQAIQNTIVSEWGPYDEFTTNYP